MVGLVGRVLFFFLLRVILAQSGQKPRVKLLFALVEKYITVFSAKCTFSKRGGERVKQTDPSLLGENEEVIAACTPR